MTDTWTIDLSIAKNTDKKVWTRQLFAARTGTRGGTLIEREKRVKSSAEVISGFVRSSLDQAFFPPPWKMTPTASVEKLVEKVFGIRGSKANSIHTTDSLACSLTPAFIKSFLIFTRSR